MQINENIFSFQNILRPTTSIINNIYFENHPSNFNINQNSNLQKFNQTSREFGKEISYLNNLTTYNNEEYLSNNSFFTNKNIYEKKPNFNVNDNKRENIQYQNFQNENNFLKEQIINNEIIAKVFDNIEKPLTINIEENKDNTFDVEMKEEKEEINPQEVKEYFEEIYNNLIKEQEKIYINPNYMLYQNDINEKMRSILLDWLIEVHLKFKLVPETMYLTVHLIDKYLEKKQVKRNKLQLVGVTAMLIACKSEEMYPPEVKDFIYITDKAYNKEEVLNMEIEMLKTLNYDITFPTQYKFLEFYKKKLNLDEKSFFYSWYCLELSLIDYKMIKYDCKIIAASACFISLHLFKIYNDDLLENVTGFKINDLKDCVKDICYIIENGTYNLQAVKKKFSLSNFMKVAKIQFW